MEKHASSLYSMFYSVIVYSVLGSVYSVYSVILFNSFAYGNSMGIRLLYTLFYSVVSVYSVLVFKLSCSVILSSSLVWRSSCGVIEVIYKNFFSELSSPVMGLSEC